MEATLTDIGGFWSGVLVHLENVIQVHVYLTVSGDSISGRYELPEIKSEYNRGSFKGSMHGGTVLKIELSHDDPHGHLEFDVLLAESHGKYMLLGAVPLRGVEVPLG